MKTMTDVSGQAWTLGDLVLMEKRGMTNRTQGVVTGIISTRIIKVKFPGQEVSCFVTGMTNLSRGRSPAVLKS